MIKKAVVTEDTPCVETGKRGTVYRKGEAVLRGKDPEDASVDALVKRASANLKESA